mmetsp:Transcript_21574/g.71462  ORF Transcript_21574/g.71462 Transcript_21574/m.71462 type:complete len:213 (-) Transcript_21574:590-1228(-)
MLRKLEVSDGLHETCCAAKKGGASETNQDLRLLPRFGFLLLNRTVEVLEGDGLHAGGAEEDCEVAQRPAAEDALHGEGGGVVTRDYLHLLQYSLCYRVFTHAQEMHRTVVTNDREQLSCLLLPLRLPAQNSVHLVLNKPRALLMLPPAEAEENLSNDWVPNVSEKVVVEHALKGGPHRLDSELLLLFFVHLCNLAPELCDRRVLRMLLLVVL